MRSFCARVVLVTGGASGIGRCLVRTLHREGARVGALDRNAVGLADLARELGAARFATAHADVTDAGQLREAVADLEKRLGPTEVLIANAGIIRETSALDFRPEDFAAEVQVNLLGVANSMAAVLPGMRARRAGHLVAISSTASYRGVPLLAGYCASKAGVNALCDAFRVELAPLGIHVTIICPGFIQTDIAAHLDIPEPPPMLAVEDAVERMLRAIRREQAFCTFPARDSWQVRLLRYLPRWWSDWLVARMHSAFLRSRCRARKAASQAPSSRATGRNEPIEEKKVGAGVEEKT
jgi:NAD(P)-dependent dehydrogenase (short-subunit alcohol dehydrogenase family)